MGSSEHLEIGNVQNLPKHRVCHYLSRKLEGEAALEFSSGVMADVTTQFPLLFESVELGTAGRVDFDQLLQNLGDKPPEAKRAVLGDGLNELTYAPSFSRLVVS